MLIFLDLITNSTIELETMDVNIILFDAVEGIEIIDINGNRYYTHVIETA